MRVGIDVRLAAYRRGGISTYVRRLVHALAAIGSADRFLLLQGRRGVPVPLPAPNFRGSRLLTPPHHPLEQWTLPLELARHPLDVLHSPDFIPPFRRRCPSVVTIHDLAFLMFPETKTVDSLGYYAQVRRAVVEAEAVIAVSETTKQDLLTQLDVPAERVTVIHHGVAPVYRRLVDRDVVAAFCRSQGLPSRFVLWVGTVEPRKNLDCLLQAFAEAAPSLPAELAHLVLVGERGWLYERVEELFRSLGLAERTTWFGPADERQLVMLYNAAWAFAFPSLYEGFGLPPLEAMACGAPVLSSHAPAMCEVLGSAARYFDPHDYHALASLLLELARDESARQGLSSAGVARAARYRWSDAARKTLDVYHKAAAR